MMSTQRRIAAVSLAAVGIALAGSSLLWAQPGGAAAGTNQPQGQGDRERRAEPPTDGKALRAFLQRRSENLRKQMERNEAALKRLDEGADAEAVRAELMREWRDRPSDDAGPAAPQSPPGGGKGDRPDTTGRKDGRAPAGQSFLGEPMVRLSPSEREASMAVIREERPGLAATIEAVAKLPDVGERVYDLIGFRLRGLAEVRRDKDMLGLRMNEIAGLLDVLRFTADYSRERRAGAPEATLSAIKDKLRSAAAEQFDVRLKIQQRSVDQLIGRSERMRSDLAKLAENRERIIDEKTAQLLRLAERQPPDRSKARPARPPE